MRIDDRLGSVWGFFIKETAGYWLAFLSLIFQTSFCLVFCEIPSAVLLARFSLKYSYVVYLIYVFQYELYLIRHTSCANSTANRAFKHGAWIGLVVGLGLLGLIAVTIT